MAKPTDVEVAKLGIVYVLSNPSMPGMVKIGKTENPDMQVRLEALYSTGVPLPFKCELAFEVKDETLVEHALHDVLHKQRVNQNREFFQIEPVKLRPLLELLGSEIRQDGWYAGIDAASRAAAATFAVQAGEDDPNRVFMQEMSNVLQTDHDFPKPRGLHRRHWNFSSGFHRIHYNVGFYGDATQVRVRLSIFRDGKESARQLFDMLKERRPDIDGALNLEDVQWERELEKSECMITAYAPGSIDSSEELWTTHNWLVETAVKFREVFTRYLEELEPTSRKM